MVYLGLVVVAFGIAATVVMVFSSQRPVDVGLQGGRLRPCPPKPNCVCSQDSGEASVAPFELVGSPSEALDRIEQLVRDDANAEVVERRGNWLHAVWRTPVLRFRDDVEFLVAAEGPGALVHVRSASRVGHSDLGANRRRVEELRQRLTR